MGSEMCIRDSSDSVAAADCVPLVLPHGPLTMESINATLVDRLPQQVRGAAVAAGLPAGSVWLLVEVGAGDPQNAMRAARAIVADLDGSVTTEDVTAVPPSSW